MKSTFRIGLNGFGRIGRAVYRIAQSHSDIEIAHINDPAPAETLIHLLKYDSVHGAFPLDLHLNNSILYCRSIPTLITHHRNPQDIPWLQSKLDVIIDCSGFFLDTASAQMHLQAGVPRVLLSAPPKDDHIKTVVYGVNQSCIEATDTVISNASCTTNCAAPMLSVLKSFGIEEAYVTTVHSYTNDQRLLDGPHNDLRRARAAAMSIIPTSTGAAKALTRIFPELNGRIGGCGMRVPVPDGSLTDITCVLSTPVQIQQINAAFKHASETHLKGIMGYTDDPIVGVDVIGNANSVLFDSEFTSIVGNLVKVIGWYDNEWGYSNRLIDITRYWLQKSLH